MNQIVRIHLDEINFCSVCNVIILTRLEAEILFISVYTLKGMSMLDLNLDLIHCHETCLPSCFHNLVNTYTEYKLSIINLSDYLAKIVIVIVR